MKCRQCGKEGSGNYCASCGAPLEAEEEGFCPACGAEVEPGAYFCTACGEPLREQPEKSLKEYMPWILSALALVAFAVGITLLIQGQTSPRAPGDPPTGGVSAAGGRQMEDGGSPGAAAGGGGAPMAGGQEGMPSATELQDMSPRQAADRLFNRAMRLEASGDPEGRAPFFARMGVRAYGRVPDGQADADLRFHVGLLQLVQGNAAAAAEEADAILSSRPGHLLGLLLSARAAEAAGDSAAGVRWRDSLRAAADTTDLASRPEYRAHEALLREFVGGG